MKINGIPYRSIRLDEADGWSIRILDQTKLPWQVEWLRLIDEDQVAHAIRSMQVRGAPLIGATAAFGVTLGTVGRWQFTRVTKRIQTELRRKAFEHAAA